MVPYYQDESATLYLGDCVLGLPHVPTVDLLLTDPPYGVAFQSGRSSVHGVIIGDGENQKSEILAALSVAIRRLREFRHVYIFGPLDLSALPLGGLTPLVWDKECLGMGNLESPWAVAHEPITFGVYVPSAANRARGDGKLAGRLRRSTVLRYPRTNSRAANRHPTEKPVPLLRELIESSSMMGETVLDPFCGVGSTLVAAKLEGRKSIGFEIDPEYCRIAAERLVARCHMGSGG